MKSKQSARSVSKRDYWRGMISKWECSGCATQAAFCRQSGISIKSFSRWRKVFAREQSQPPSRFGFATLQVKASKPAGSGIRIVLPHDTHIDIAPGFDETTLRRVLNLCI